MTQKALYLAGGGARGAYQAGVLKAIHQILQVKKIPFDTLTGVSVGSINAVVLAEQADDFPNAIEKIENLWGEIHCQQIYKTSNYELSKSVLRNLSTLVIKQQKSGFLLDTSPLHQFLDDHVDFSRIEQHITNGTLSALEVIASCYERQQSHSFYMHHNHQFPDWQLPRHVGQRSLIQAEHVLASSALPLFFPTVPLAGLHYGDGSMGLITPLRGPIRFNVDQIMILGTREFPEGYTSSAPSTQVIPFARVLATLLSNLFLDTLDRDIETVNRMNEIARMLSIWNKHRSPWRPISTLYLRPLQPISILATKHYETMPALLRYMLNVLGSNKKSGDLLSFLLFEKEFTRELITMGYDDTMKNAKEVEAFFAA